MSCMYLNLVCSVFIIFLFKADWYLIYMHGKCDHEVYFLNFHRGPIGFQSKDLPHGSQLWLCDRW